MFVSSSALNAVHSLLQSVWSFQGIILLSLCLYQRRQLSAQGSLEREKSSNRKFPASLYPFGAKEHTSSSTHLRHNRLLFTKEFIIIFAFFIVCFVFLGCGVSSKLFFSFFWLQFGERNHQEFFGPVIEHGCSNRCLCFVSIDVLIH